MDEEEEGRGRGVYRSRTRMNQVRLDQLRYPPYNVPKQFPKIQRSLWEDGQAWASWVYSRLIRIRSC